MPDVPDTPTAATDVDETIVPQHGGEDALVLAEPGYTVGEVIGRGGMGEVVSAHDRRIGRDVAIKRMLAAAPSKSALDRFLREARIQARLDHPTIVPVHELGLDAEGRPYFTMKRLRAVTLAQKMAEGVPLSRLLHAFVEVCLAIEFAHSRRVVHRDLKPSNIMLGDYGEVYVLDWGIARVLDGKGRAPSVAGEIDTLGEGTQTGDLLGTPGYMAPEQVRGTQVETPADVYALGAILFELLAGQPLHPRGTAGLASALTEPQQAPATRAPAREIAPELDDACVAALAEDPRARPTARELGERVQAYLEGDRDHARRRKLAADSLAAAHAAHDSGDPEQRATAIQQAGRALALDPTSEDASRLVTQLIVEPPREMPAALSDELARDDIRAARSHMRAIALSLLGVVAVALMLPWMKIENWTTLGIFAVSLSAMVAWLAWASRNSPPNLVRSLTAAFVICLAFSRVLGLLVLTPIVISGALLSLSGNPLVQARRWLLWAFFAAVVGVPLVLEAAGVFAQTVVIDHEMMCLRSPIFASQRFDAYIFGVANVVLLGAIAVYGNNINRQMTAARRDLKVQAWHLGHLLPERVRT